MKIADLFAAISVKIEGLDELKDMRDVLKDIDTTLRSVVQQLTLMGRIKTPGVSSASVGARVGGRPKKPPKLPKPKSGKPTNPQDAAAQQVKASRINTGAIMKLALGVTTLVGTMQLLRDGIKSAMNTASGQARSQSMLGTIAGVNAQTFQQWSRLQRLSGADSVVSGLADLQGRLTRIGMTLEPATRWMSFADTRLPALDYVREFIEKTKGMSPAQATQAAAEAGISQDLVYAVKNFGAQLSEAGRVTQEQYDQIQQLNIAWGNLKDVSVELATVFGALASGPLVPILKGAAAVMRGDEGARMSLARGAASAAFPVQSMIARALSNMSPAGVAVAGAPQVTQNMYFQGMTDAMSVRDAARDGVRGASRAQFSNPQPSNNR